MTEDELAELECHMAAGTDLPTAFAALPQDKPRRAIRWWWLLLSFAIALAAWWFLR